MATVTVTVSEGARSVLSITASFDMDITALKTAAAQFITNIAAKECDDATAEDEMIAGYDGFEPDDEDDD